MKFLLKLAMTVILWGALIIAAVWANPSWRMTLVDQALNQALTPHLKAIKVQDVELDSKLRIHLLGLSGLLNSNQGDVPLFIEGVKTKQSFLNFLLRKPVEIDVHELKLNLSKYPGINGALLVQNSAEGQFQFKAESLSLGLEDLIPFNPEHLKGSAGQLKGQLEIAGDESEIHTLDIKLESVPPGGMLQSRFFALLLPYLPQAKALQVKNLAEQTQTVHYVTATLKVSLPSSDTIKAILTISIPEYNLKLNLNLAIKVDSENAISDLLRLMGFFEVKQT